MSKLPYRIFFDVNVAVRRGGGTEECRNGKKERREGWKDEEKVNEETDAPGNLFLAPDMHTSAHKHTCSRTPKHHGKTHGKSC